MNLRAVTQRLQGCLRDWVGVASNCTMGLFPGRHGCLAAFIGYYEIAQETGSKFALLNAGIRGYTVAARPRIHFEHRNNMKHVLLLVVREATENGKAYKRNNCASTFPALLYAAWTLKGILQLLLDRWTCFSDNCWFARDVTAAMLAMFSPLSCKFFKKKFYCIDPQYGRLVT